MTIAELIEILKTFDQALEVRLADQEDIAGEDGSQNGFDCKTAHVFQWDGEAPHVLLSDLSGPSISYG